MVCILGVSTKNYGVRANCNNEHKILDDTGMSNDISTPGLLDPQQNADISLPVSLFQRINDTNNVGIFFTFYQTGTLFPVGGVSTDIEAAKRTQVGSSIVGASIVSTADTTDLEDPVVITFRLRSIPNTVRDR